MKRWTLPLVLLVLAAGVACFFFFARGDIAAKKAQAALTPVLNVPQGAQVLTFPLKSGWISAGYQNANYLKKNKFQHYGTDFYDDKGYANVFASGGGVVLGTEFCKNSVGNIAVIRYDNVFLPSTGEQISLIARYYHMLSLSVKEGDRVTEGQTIGAVDSGHEWYHHVHMELDTDLDHPFHTPQVAEATSELLQRASATGSGMLDPVTVLAVAEGCTMGMHPYSDSVTEKDTPHFRR